MKNISDERLEQMLTAYCNADLQQPFTYQPKENTKKVISLSRFQKAALAAASLVLVSVLSITIYSLFENKFKSPLAVAPSLQSATTPSAQTGESGGDTPQPTGDSAPTENLSLIEQLLRSLNPNRTGTSSGSSSTGQQSSSGGNTPNTPANPGVGATEARNTPGGAPQSNPLPQRPTTNVSPTQAPPTPGAPTEGGSNPTPGAEPTENNGTAPSPEPHGGDDNPPPGAGGNVVRLINTLGWREAYVYAWDEDGNCLSGDWPGILITQTEVNDYGETIFIYEIPEGAVGIIFNDGNGSQTEDITDFNDNNYYWFNGDINEFGHYEVIGAQE